MTWRRIDKGALVLLHDESLAEHGGRAGSRDEGLLDSALNKPLNLLAYGEPDFADLAASYASGLAKNHPFVDGNKRAAFLAVGMFLYLNGYRLQASQKSRKARSRPGCAAAPFHAEARFSPADADQSPTKTARARPCLSAGCWCGRWRAARLRPTPRCRCSC